MTKADFIDWKRHPVTQQVFSQLDQRVNDLKEEIVGSALDGDPRTQAYRAGAIGAYNDMLKIDYEESHGN